jgi:hypothetical protein
MRDRLWGELEEGARRYPRFDAEQCGACPICRCGATTVEEILSVWWASCAPCRTRWSLGLHAFELPALDEDEERELHELPGGELDEELHLEILQARLSRLAALLDVDAAMNDGAPMRTTTDATQKTLILDPHRLLEPRDTRPLRGLNQEHRERIGGLVARWLVENRHRINLKGPAPFVGLGEIRTEVIDHQGRTVDDVLRGQVELVAGMALVDVAKVILRALERRSDLRRQLAELDALFGPSDTVTR